jgi:predicted metalloendopeptidase
MFELMGESPEVAARSTQTVLKIETNLAQSAMTNIEERDPKATCNRMNIAGLQKIAKGYDWPGYFTAIGLSRIDTFNVAQPKFFAKVGQLIRTIAPKIGNHI